MIKKELSKYIKHLIEFRHECFMEEKKQHDPCNVKPSKEIHNSCNFKPNEEDTKNTRSVKLYDMIDNIGMNGTNNYMKLNLDLAKNFKSIIKCHRAEALHTDSIIKCINERDKIDDININKHSLWARKFYTLLSILWKLKDMNDGIHIIISEDDNIIWGVKGLSGLLKVIDSLTLEIERMNLSYYSINFLALQKLLLVDNLNILKMELRKEDGIKKIVIEEIADWLAAFYQRVSDYYYKLWVNRHNYYNPKGEI